MTDTASEITLGISTTHWESPTEASLFIPLSSQGTVICFESRTPTVDKLYSLTHLTFTTDAVWNPKLLNCNPSTVICQHRLGHIHFSPNFFSDYFQWSTTSNPIVPEWFLQCRHRISFCLFCLLWWIFYTPSVCHYSHCQRRAWNIRPDRWKTFHRECQESLSPLEHQTWCCQSYH